MHLHHNYSQSKHPIISSPLPFLMNNHFHKYKFHYNYHHHRSLASPPRSPSPFYLLAMSNSSKLCLKHLGKWGRSFLQRLKTMSKRRDPKILLSGFDWNSSSFAAMEVSNQLKQVFKLIDANGDGKISSFELCEVLLCLGHEKLAAKKEAEGMMRELDCNGDGYIDLDEFMDAVVGCGDKEDGLVDAFLVFDSDKNGFISAKELQHVLVGLGYDKCSLNECFLMIKGVDKDGDGLVDFEEFKSMMTAFTG